MPSSRVRAMTILTSLNRVPRVVEGCRSGGVIMVPLLAISGRRMGSTCRHGHAHNAFSRTADMHVRHIAS